MGKINWAKFPGTCWPDRFFTEHHYTEVHHTHHRSGLGGRLIRDTLHLIEAQSTVAQQTGRKPHRNKAFVGLRNCDNVKTERSIFEYAKWPRLQIKRSGPSSWSVHLVCQAGPSSWSIQLVRLADPFTHCILHIPSYTIHLAHCF